MYLGSFDIDDYVGIPADCHRFSSGAAYAATSLTYSIYEDATTTGLDEDVDMTPASPFDSITGHYWARRQLTAAAGFEAGKNYHVVVKATVDSVAAIQTHIFQIKAKVDARAIGGTTQTGRDIGASVLLSVGTGTGQVNLSSGKVPATVAAADVTGNVATDLQTIKTQTVTCAAGVTVLASVGTAATSTAQTGDCYARIGAPAGASVSADVAAIKGETASIVADTGTDGVVVAAASKTGYALSAAGVQAIWDVLTAALTAVGSIGKKLADWTIGTTQTANVADLITTVGAAGAGLTALGDARLANLDATVSSRLAPAGTLATVTNLTNAPTAGDLTAAMKASINTEVADNLGVDTIAEMAQGIPPATPTVIQALMYLYMTLRNQLTTTATEKAIYNNAGTKIAKKVLSDDATTYTEAKMISGA